jgi:hypothetical protein
MDEAIRKTRKASDPTFDARGHEIDAPLQSPRHRLLSRPMFAMEIDDRLATERDALLAHPIYGSLTTIANLRVFMANHVFAVWDFMSVLKELQRRITCLTTPWLPPADPSAARIINEIVLAEESDEIAAGEYLDHFRLYVMAMKQIEADTKPIDQLLQELASGSELEPALAALRIPMSTRQFVLSTMNSLRKPTHELLAVFLFGRESLIPAMFGKILGVLESSGLQTAALRTYLARHIEVDGDQHGPQAHQLLLRWCGDDEDKSAAATTAARAALEARRHLWDGTLASMTTSSSR